MVVIQFVIDSVTICKADAGFAPGKEKKSGALLQFYTVLLYHVSKKYSINYCAVRLGIVLGVLHSMCNILCNMKAHNVLLIN